MKRLAAVLAAVALLPLGASSAFAQDSSAKPCADFVTCAQACPASPGGAPDQACLQQCAMQYPEGYQGYQALVNCAQQAGCNPNDPSVGQCIAQNCPDEAAACQPEADPTECPDFVACVEQCPGAATGNPDPACAQGCAGQYPGGAAAFTEFAMCVQQAGCDPQSPDFEQCASTNCPDEVAACFGAPPGGGGNCPDGIGADPTCQGDTLVWCENGAVQEVDCAQDGLTCGFDEMVAGYACVAAGGGMEPGGETDAGGSMPGGEMDAGGTMPGGQADAGATEPGGTTDAGGFGGLPTGGTTKKDAGAGGSGGARASADAAGPQDGGELTTGTKDSGGGGCASTAPGGGVAPLAWLIGAFALTAVARRRRAA